MHFAGLRFHIFIENWFTQSIRLLLKRNRFFHGLIFNRLKNLSTNGQSKWSTIYNHININSMKLFSPSNAIADDVFRYRFLFVNTNFRYINCIASFVVVLNVFHELLPYTYEEICEYVSITISSIYC